MKNLKEDAPKLARLHPTTTHAPLELQSAPASGLSDPPDESCVDPLPEVPEASKKRNRVVASVSVRDCWILCILYARALHQSLQNLLSAWIPHQRQKWAEMLLTVTELAPFEEQCCDTCLDENVKYICDDCHGPRFSQKCLLLEHSAHPLHRIRVSASGPLLI
jgi:hypothetical protein